MPIPYKMEIFSPEFDFRGGVAISDPEISFDYLSLDKISLAVPTISAEKGDYVHITNYMGGIVFQGIAADVSSDKYTTTISISPLLSILDVKAHFNRDDLSTASLESFIADIITGLYIANDDDLQNITGLSVGVNSNTYGTTVGLESNVAELYTIITSALSAYGIVVSAEIDPQAKTFNISIGKVEDSVVIEADPKNVIERNFVIGDSYGAVNKITFINQDDEAQQVTYYLHTDGTVGTNDEDRVMPVFASIEYIGGSKFSEDAANRATKTLSPQQYNNLIELTYAANDKIINFETIAIGTQAYIKKGSGIYRSVYTGYEKMAETIKLVFGIVRVDLTKKLILDKRSRGNSLSIASSGGGEGVIQPGIMTMFGGTIAPDGWLLCDGSAISRTEYADLFSAIGTTWGVGNGSTTFNLPPPGRVPIGRNSSDTDLNTVGKTGGSKTKTFLFSNFPSMFMRLAGYGDIASSSKVGAKVGALVPGDYAAVDVERVLGVGNTDKPVNIMNPYMVVNYIIKT